MKSFVREALWEDLPGIWKLCSRLFPEYKNSQYSEFQNLFSHRWLNNPARTDVHPLGWLAQNEYHEIVGFVGLIPMRFQIGEKIVPAASGTSWCVDLSYRSMSFELYRCLMQWGDHHLLFDTTSGIVANQFHVHLKLGMKKIPLEHFDRRFFWILNPNQLLKWKKMPLGFRWLAAQALKARFFKQMRLKRSEPLFHIDLVNTFEEKFDHFWKAQRKNFAITMVRDRVFLNWRYGSSHALGGKFYTFVAMARVLSPHFPQSSMASDWGTPVRHHPRYASEDHKNILGYLVLHERGFRNKKPGHFVVADLFFNKEYPSVVKDLFLYAVEFVKSKKGMILEMTGFHPRVMESLIVFSPWVRPAISWTYWVKGMETYPDLTKEDLWWPSAVDGDLNL